MRFFVLIILFINLVCASCTTRPTAHKAPPLAVPLIGGPCEICDLINVGLPTAIDHIDTSSIWTPASALLIEGQVFEADGKTPAEDVLLYYWHTDTTGVYPQSTEIRSEATVHGSIRGWIKTDHLGRYQLLTRRPGSYPSLNEPSHIHWVVKEPELMNSYYIDAMVFADDSLLTKEQRRSHDNRGGSMILHPRQIGNMEVAEKNIILGLNIPNHPANRKP